MVFWVFADISESSVPFSMPPYWFPIVSHLVSVSASGFSPYPSPSCSHPFIYCGGGSSGFELIRWDVLYCISEKQLRQQISNFKHYDAGGGGAHIPPTAILIRPFSKTPVAHLLTFHGTSMYHDTQVENWWSKNCSLPGLPILYRKSRNPGKCQFLRNLTKNKPARQKKAWEWSITFAQLQIFFAWR